MTSKRTPATWQTNPNHIKTAKVQYWRNGIMLTAQMTLSDAKEAVRNGSAFVISKQAIGALVNGQFAS